MEIPLQQRITEFGPYYTGSEYSGKFSDKLMDCGSDMNSCLMCTIPCLWPVLFHEILKKNSGPLPLGLSSKTTVVWVYLAVVLMFFLVPELELKFVLWMLLGAMLNGLNMMVMTKYKIEKSDYLAIFESLCCHGCLLAQIHRHVGRAYGFLPPVLGFELNRGVVTRAPPTDSISV